MNRIRKIFIRCCTSLIFNKKLRKKVRAKFISSPIEINDNVTINDTGISNIIDLPDKNTLPGKIIVNISGDNNLIQFKDICSIFGTVSISLHANDARIILGRKLHIAESLRIICGQNHKHFGYADNAEIIIMDNVCIENLIITTFNSNISIAIEEKTVISYGVTIYHTDAHPIYNKKTGTLINLPRDLKIGKGSWLGASTTILKNVHLAEGTIVGYGSIVTKSFNEPFTAIAGNPAKKIKDNVIWKYSDPAYIRNDRAPD